jgi:hypothetical protein
MIRDIFKSEGIVYRERSHQVYIPDHIYCRSSL